MARKWLQQNIEQYKNNEYFIIVLGTDSPHNINEIFLQKLKFQTIFIDFLEKMSIKQMLAKELDKAETAYE